MIGHDRRNEDDKGHKTDTYYRTLIVGDNYNIMKETTNTKFNIVENNDDLQRWCIRISGPVTSGKLFNMTMGAP